MTEEERAAMRWLHCGESEEKVEQWRRGWDSDKTADAGKLARSCYAEGFLRAAVRAYRMISDSRHEVGKER